MTDEDREAFIKGITDLANSEKVKRECEPNLMYHGSVTQSQVLRVLYAQKILMEEHEKKTTTVAIH